MALDDKIPKVPEFSSMFPGSMYKFVQLYVDEEPYLRYGGFSNKHEDLIRQFILECREKGQPITDLALEKVTRSSELLKSGRYEAVGFGYIERGSELIRGSNALIISGESLGFEIGPNKEHFEKLAKYIPNWKIELLKLPSNFLFPM